MVPDSGNPVPSGSLESSYLQIWSLKKPVQPDYFPYRVWPRDLVRQTCVGVASIIPVPGEVHFAGESARRSFRPVGLFVVAVIRAAGRW